MKKRLDRLRALFQEHDADTALLTFLPDIRWACGFTGSNGLLVVRDDATHFLTDGRYAAQAQREVKGATVHVPGYDLLGHAAEEELFGTARKVLFQSEHVSVAQLDSFHEHFPEIEWQSAEGLLRSLVASKDEEEVEQIRAAQRITEKVFEHLLGFIEPGVTERDVAAEIVYRHLKAGADKMSFEPIVASGSNGALPHARPTGKSIEPGELVVIDMGCFLEGYASDMTRTVAIGDLGEEAREAYRSVLDAQKRALEGARAGLTGKELDSVAREVIEERGYGEYFSHGLGHGIGLQTHEWPRVSYHAEDELPEGATVTIEPGIYVPENFGIRIEDIVVLREDGCENLTSAPKGLIVL